MIFQTELTTLDTELSQLQALLEAKRQQRSLFEELDTETNAAIETIALLKTKIEAVSSDAIASLKSAVLTLFENGNNGNDGGNQPTDPTPEPDDDGPELLCFNGLTGDCLTTADIDDEELLVDDPTGDDWVLSSDAPLTGQTCDINPALYWENNAPDGSYWEFASPLACLLWEDAPMLEQYCTIIPIDNENKGTEAVGTIPQLSSTEISTEAVGTIPQLSSPKEDTPQPQKSSTELIHLSSNCGYLKLKNDDSILAAYCWFSRKNIAEAWASEIEVIPTAKTELRESKRNPSWKWELKITGINMNQIERLAAETLHQKPSKKKETPAQVAGLEPPNGWRQAQPTKVRNLRTEAQVTAEAPKKARITLESSPYNGHVCDVVEVSGNWWTLATPKGNLKYPADSVEPVDEGVQMAENKQEAEAIAFEFGDVVEVISDLNDTHMIGAFGKVKFVKNNRIALEIDEQLVYFQPQELKLRSKAEVPKEQQQLQSGQILTGNRVVTTGNYFGAARRTAIANARRGTADKLAALELVKAGLSPELAMAAAKGIDDASDF